uniref:bacteriohemerythrin n=1 Tax=Lachnospira sp. TaxID=2049031 RepID=UPI0040288F10
MYEFTNDCLIGIKEIDDEHARLFKMVNDAIAMSNELDDITPVANNLIANLKDYAATHFAHEEAYMESINDPELALQKKEHAAFTKKVNEFQLDNSSNEAAKASFNNCISYLVRWLYRHILSNDMMIGKMCTVSAESTEETENSLFAFTDKYKTGIELVDDEHRRLFEIIDQTYTLIHDDFAHDKYDQIMHLLEQLKDYTEFHFNDEEELMERIGYPDINSQKKAHSAFIEKLVNIDIHDLDAMDDNQQQYLLDLVNFLVTWLSNHILGADKKIGEYMAANNIA